MGDGERTGQELRGVALVRHYLPSGPWIAVKPSTPALIANVFQERSFGQRDQLAIWDTLVLCFRGGDILSPATHSGYSQGPCSLFFEAWKVLNVSKAMLVYDAESAVNPCVEVVREKIGNASLVDPPRATVSCHMTFLGMPSM